MNEVILIELANRWEADSYRPAPSDCAVVEYEQGVREAKRACAADLRSLVDILGGETAGPPMTQRAKGGG